MSLHSILPGEGSKRQVLWRDEEQDRQAPPAVVAVHLSGTAESHGGL